MASADPQRATCDNTAHQRWLQTCFDLIGTRNPPDWQWSVDANGYYAGADLVREFTADCLVKTGSPSARRRTSEDLACAWQSHVDWLASCVTEELQLVGETRRDLLNVLQTEGGISTHTFRHYQHRRCFPLKAEVTFEPRGSRATALELTPDLSWHEGLDDNVTKVVPYVGWFIVD